MIASKDIHVNARAYEAVHGKPVGLGTWRFQILEGEVVWCTRVTFEAAVLVALEKAQQLGSYEVIVLP